MYKGSHKDFACLLNMLDAITKIEKYTAAHSNAEEIWQIINTHLLSLKSFIKLETGE